MIRLRLFGGAFLERDGQPVGGAAAQRHRLALLALLALPEPRPVARDRLLALLWPENDTDHARNLLNQSVHSLRRALGEGSLHSVGDNLALDADLIECDVHTFEAARRRGDPEAAAAAYTGPFLDGFFLRGSGGFEEWTAAERDRLARAYGDVLEAVAEARELAGDLRGAAEAWRNAANHNPLASAVALRLMQALTAAGDPAAALRHARAHAAWLHHEVGAQPDAAVLRFEHELREQLAAPPAAAPVVAAPPAADASIPSAAAPTASLTVQPETRWLPWRWVLASSLVLIAAVAAVGWMMRRNGAVPAETTQVVAILPFRVSGADAGLNYLREGMLDLLAAKLTGEGGPRAVDPRTLMVAWRRATASATTDLDARQAAALAARLGAGLMLLGEVVGMPDRVVIHGALLRAPDAHVVGRATVIGPADSIAALADRLASTLLSLAAGESDDRLDQLLTTSPEALRAYLDGKIAHRASQFTEASDAYQRALRLDSAFALAALGLAMSAEWEGATASLVPSARALARSGVARMSRADRLFVQLGGIGTDPDAPPAAEWLARALELVQAAPDAVEAWNILGDAWVHAGSMTGAPEWRRHAADALDRAIALDSSFSPPRFHRIELAAAARDTSTMRRLLQLEGDAASPEFLWYPAVVAGDSAQVRLIEARWISRSPSGHAQRAVREGIGVSRLRALMPHRARPRDHLSAIRMAAEDAAIAWPAGEGDRALRVERALADLLEATFTDSIGAGVHAAHLRDGMAAMCSPERAGSDIATSVCTTEAFLALGLHAARHGDRAMVLDYANRIRRLPAADLPRQPAAALELAALTLDAAASRVSGDPDPRLVARLDSATAIGATNAEMVLVMANVALAALQVRLDDPRAALRALARRPWYTSLLLAPALREEGRLAALTGDRARAARAYAHYLALRAVPGQPSIPQVDSVRAELERLRLIASN